MTALTSSCECTAILNRTLSSHNYSWYRDYAFQHSSDVRPCPRNKKWIYIYTQGRSGSTMLGRLLRSSRTLCHCEEQLEDPKHYYLYEPLHAFPGKLNVSMVDSIYGDMTQCNISPIFPQLKADTMNSRVFNSWPLFCPFSTKDMDVDTSAFGCIFLDSFQMDSICSRACVRVIKDIRLKNLSEQEQRHILFNLLTSNPNLQEDAEVQKQALLFVPASYIRTIIDVISEVIYLSRDPRGVYNSMNNTRVFKAKFSSICGFTNRANRIVANLSSIFGSQRIFEVAYEQLASRPFAAIFDLFKKLDITFSIETVNWIVENMMRADKETDSSHQSSYSTDERNAQAEALKWKTDSGRELQKGFEQDPFCQKLSSLKQLS